MNNNVTSGHVLSFVDLLEKHRIEIPIIQRDYAQGRSENKDILIEFLSALKASILEDKEIKLDFIYGEIVDDVFQPLDGQQRLTTLFLLHWYAVLKEGINTNLLSKFTYETRLSSRHFCNNLIEKSVVPEYENSISTVIRNSNWFYLSWEQDPSIKAMLNTLDNIQTDFEDVPDLWKRLAEQKLIKFHYLNLQDLGLSDDLYIKMNARGKLLTPFENFKAQLQKRIEDGKWEDGYAIIDKFDYKIDTTWTDLFWYKFKNKMDIAHIKFLSAIIMHKISLNKKEVTSLRHNDLRILNDNNDGKFLLKFIDKDAYDNICKCYEIFTEVNKKNINLDFSEINFWTHSCPNSVLNEIEKDSSYTKKALLFAQIEFLSKNKEFDRKAYLDWMRVIRNFVCYSNISIKSNSSREDLLRAPEAFESMINLIKTMAEGCQDIYNFLANYTVKPGSYRKEQMSEEVLKAKKIKQNIKICNVIWKLEDLDLFRGRISFVFDCLNSMVEKGIANDEEDILNQLYGLFVKYFASDNVFSQSLFNRAMLTINVENEYKYYDYWASRWYANNAEKRKFLISLTELNYYIYSERANSKQYFLNIVLLLLEKDYKSIIEEFIPPVNMPKWKVKLIKENGWIQKRNSDFFAFTEDNLNCYLLKSQRPINVDGSILVQ